MREFEGVFREGVMLLECGESPHEDCRSFKTRLSNLAGLL